MNTITSGSVAEVSTNTGLQRAIITQASADGTELTGFLVAQGDSSEIRREWRGTNDEVISVDHSERGAGFLFDTGQWVSVTTEGEDIFVRSNENYGKFAKTPAKAVKIVISTLFELGLEGEARRMEQTAKISAEVLNTMLFPKN